VIAEAPDSSLSLPTVAAGVGKPLIVGQSDALRALCSLAKRVAVSDAKVLITGESGVGKDLIAQHVHFHSKRSASAFVAVNCAGVPESLLESELFGHVKGSFTDAVRDTAGKLRLAHNGTIFLDEVAEMSLRMQVLLLRFLESGEIQPVGADHGRARVDVRIIAATNRDLHQAVSSGQFREDLLYRLDVVHIHVPPLRERPEDIKALVLHMLSKAERKIRFSDEALRALETYRWPGNVRELQNVVERMIWTSIGDVIEPDDLPVPLQPGRVERVLAVRERRRQLADELYNSLTEGTLSFWEHVHPLFLARDLTRRDIRDLVRRGLATTLGNYRALVGLFGMPATDYKRFLNFLTTHDCVVDFHPYRSGGSNGGAGGRAAAQKSAALDSRLPRSRLPMALGGDGCL
jgi:transcriptional regulator with GAF, ATPase, and Fis domain